MGCQKLVVCSNCKYPFTVNEGGGMFFHLLKCDKCGKDRTILFSTIENFHLDTDTISEKKYESLVEKKYGNVNAEADSNLMLNLDVRNAVSIIILMSQMLVFVFTINFKLVN